MRWINIGGISWDVIKCLALRYSKYFRSCQSVVGLSSCVVEIHPLAIEDMLHGRQTYSSKADYYTKHLFIRMLCHTLKDDDDISPNVKPQHAPRATSASTSSATPPPTYTSRPTDAPQSMDKLGFDEDYQGTPAPSRRPTAPLAPGDNRPRVRTLASTSLSGAQPWMGGSSGLEGDPEKVWAKSVYPDIGKVSARTSARKYSHQLSSMFENNLVRCVSSCT